MYSRGSARVRDIVSGGELQRVLAAGGDAQGGVSPASARASPKCAWLWMRASVLQRTSRLRSWSDLSRKSPAAMARSRQSDLRVNPNVDAKTHSLYLHRVETEQVRCRLRRGNRVVPPARDIAASAHHRHGLPHRIAAHRGQARSIAAVEKVLVLADALAAEGIRFEHLDLGGGLGIC